MVWAMSDMNKIAVAWALAFAACFTAFPSYAEPIRIKDMGKIEGWRENALVGYGLVTGLAGTGDSSRNKTTRQSIANMLSRFDISVVADDVQSRNVAAVMVTASLSPFARPGDTLDVTVTSVGDARSLVGGYKYDMNGNMIQKNHPTVGSIPDGATIEAGIDNKDIGARDVVTFVLSEPDYTTASRVTGAINAAFGAIAETRDASGIAIRVPESRRARLADFLAAVENVRVEPDRRAKVVINERTGTVVAGGDVRIDKVAISHGDLKVSIVTDNTVSQPLLVRQTGPDVRTIVTANSRVNATEGSETGFVAATNNTVADLVHALARIKTNTRDIISVLRAVKAAGALHADLVVQ